MATLANVIAGNLLTLSGSDSSQYSLGAPRPVPVSATLFDVAQTLPAFAYLIPAPALPVRTRFYGDRRRGDHALPVIRLVDVGIRGVPAAGRAATASGVTSRQT
jgi:ABC-type proline/glycine betaine transport system permease subunit